VDSRCTAEKKKNTENTRVNDDTKDLSETAPLDMDESGNEGMNKSDAESVDEKQEADKKENKIEEALEAEKEKAARNYDRLLRVTAEFENYKKRVQRQMEDIKKYANESLIKELLSVVDNLERAITASEISLSEKEKTPNSSCLVEGVEMTLKEILRVLEKFNVTPLESVGKPFDPMFHEAVMQEETDQYPENTVISEMQKGYLLHDRLIRPAMVVVSKPKTGSQDSGPQEE